MDGFQIALIVVSVLCAVFGGTLKKFFGALGEAATKTSEAMDESSPGGINITPSERTILLKAWLEAWSALVASLPVIRKFFGK